jgi:hypothetical protein
MSRHHCWDRRRRPAAGAALVIGLGLAVLGLAPVAVRAAEEESEAVARSSAAEGTLLRRAAGKTTWDVVHGKGTIHNGDLVIGLIGSMIDSENGAVRVTFQADLDQVSPHPIREPGVVVHANKDVDLDLTLDRGRVDLVNLKKKGAARIRLRVLKATWELVLDEPKSSVALELYGRWPAGVGFTKNPGPKDVPTFNLIFLVLKGEVHLKHNNVEHALAAPPGPALIEWDNAHGQDESPRYLKELPKWAPTELRSPARARAVKDVLKRFHKALENNSLGEVLDQFLASDHELDRALALVVMAATDDLKRLASAMRAAKHPDVWEKGIVNLRHWIGRAPGHDQLLYQAIIKNRNFTPVDAETTLQLLHSFGETDLADPETYQSLIDYLDHEQLAIRGLAYWHLERLVRDAQKQGYNPLDPKEKRDAAIARIRKLVPKGKVPPRPTAENEKKDNGKTER